MAIEIVGVYPVEAPEPCHLVEVRFDEPPDNLDWGKVTQEVDGQPQSNWQVPWDEQPLDEETHWVFFFHYLDISKPLLTPLGPCELPRPTDLPDYLSATEYEQP
jgi:hypothetical protein